MALAFSMHQRLQSRPLRLALHEYVRDNFYTIKKLPLARSCALGKIVLSGHSHTKQMYAFVINGTRQGKKLSKLWGKHLRVVCGSRLLLSKGKPQIPHSYTVESSCVFKFTICGILFVIVMPGNGVLSWLECFWVIAFRILSTTLVTVLFDEKFRFRT